jgi:hypothetical protein
MDVGMALAGGQMSNLSGKPSFSSALKEKTATMKVAAND